MLSCLGSRSVGMSPEDYRRLTYDLVLRVARQTGCLNQLTADKNGQRLSLKWH